MWQNWQSRLQFQHMFSSNMKGEQIFIFTLRGWFFLLTSFLSLSLRAITLQVIWYYSNVGYLTLTSLSFLMSLSPSDSFLDVLFWFTPFCISPVCWFIRRWLFFVSICVVFVIPTVFSCAE
jgi:hypothetical protein